MTKYIVKVRKLVEEEYIIETESLKEAMNEAYEKFLTKYGDYDEMYWEYFYNSKNK